MITARNGMERLAVCSWSLRPRDPNELMEKLSITGIRRVQLALDPLRKSPEIWGGIGSLLQESNIEIVSGMFGCVGEDYSTMETIRATGGIAPDATWDQNLINIQSTAGLATKLGLKLVTFHAGFLPHDTFEPAFAKMVKRISDVADVFGEREIALGLETGQETAPSLVTLLGEVNHSNVGVNFDPANMILYDKGDPIAALRVLGPWLRQVHIKDGKRTKSPGTWGEETVVGKGEVNWGDFFGALHELNFNGNLVIEREAREERLPDICAARDLVLRQLQK